MIKKSCYSPITGLGPVPEFGSGLKYSGLPVVAKMKYKRIGTKVKKLWDESTYSDSLTWLLQ